MMNFILSHKILVIGIALLVAVFAWFGLSGTGSGSSSLLTTEVISNEGPEKDLVATLLALRAVKLDASLFSDQAFISLKDFSTQIVPEPVGRPNPFAPIGQTVVTASSSKASQVFPAGGKK